MTNRKFYKTVIQVEILSEEPYATKGYDLGVINYDITEGDCSGDIKHVSQKVLNGRQAAKELEKQRSDPGFFRLDENGNDVD